jgi:hypothetical protein
MEIKKPANPPFYEDRLRYKNLLFSKKLPEPKGNTTYEELKCVGFQPELNRLEGVVYIKQPVGYGGDICSAGTPEYVRFFLSYNNGATWQDQGLTSFTAHNIPAAARQRLEYAVTLKIDPKKHACMVHNFPRVRAILSWHVPPPAGRPNFTPHWGNIHETVIQIAPTRRPLMKDLLEWAKIELPLELAQVVDPDQEIAGVEPPALTLAQLAELYKEKHVAPHRFGFATALKLMDDPNVLTAAATDLPTIAKDIPFDLAGVLEKLGELKGDTSAEPKGDVFYEELDCVGLDPVTSELVATFRVKQGCGYSGGLCTKGSVEYITFWGDFNGNGTFETCLGTVGVRVHDFWKIPEGGLEYAAALPVDLNHYRQLCTAGPKVVHIRAMLSWNVPHPCGSPNKSPVWGNAEDTWILIPPGITSEPGKFDGYLYTVCGVNICAIDPATGLTTPGDQPFGSTLNITGEIPGAPSVVAPDRFKYKVWYRPLDPAAGGWQSLANDFWIWVTEGSGGIPTTSLLLQQVDAGGWYTYREYGSPVTGSWRRVTGPDRLLGQWGTVKTQTGRWEIGIEFQDTVTSAAYWASWQKCPDASWRRNAVVYLDQVPPSPSLSSSLQVSTDGGLTWTDAKECDTLVKGVLLRGTYTVSDEHFRYLHLYVEPWGAAHSTAVSPATRYYGSPDFVPTTGETGTWTLDTKNMDPCGYVIRLDVWDRTIVSCDSHGWSNAASIGFCLKAK